MPKNFPEPTTTAEVRAWRRAAYEDRLKRTSEEQRIADESILRSLGLEHLARRGPTASPQQDPNADRKAI